MLHFLEFRLALTLSQQSFRHPNNIKGVRCANAGIYIRVLYIFRESSGGLAWLQRYPNIPPSDVLEDQTKYIQWAFARYPDNPYQPQQIFSNGYHLFLWVMSRAMKCDA